jgi:biotin carboxyl carrier protein
MTFIARLGDHTYSVEIEEIGKGLYKIAVDENEFLVDGKKTGRTSYSLIVDNRSFEIEIDHSADEYRVLVDGRNYRVHLIDERRARVDDEGIQLQGRQKISVPMPGRVTAVLVSEGDLVEKGQGLLIVEAMKMENEVRTPIAGKVEAIKVKPGDAVEGGAVLMIIE